MVEEEEKEEERETYWWRTSGIKRAVMRKRS